MSINIIVCHNSKSASRLLSNILTHTGTYGVSFCDAVAPLLSRMKETPIDLIIVGDDLKDCTTIQLIETLKSAEDSQNIPVLVVPGELSEIFVSACHEVGADGVMNYPFEKTEFLKMVALLTSSDKSICLKSKIKSHGYSILVTEDSLSYQRLYYDLIEELGCQAHLYTNGKEAWEALDSGLYVDLIITDIIMPIMDGKEFTQLVRSDIRFDKVPIIVSSTIDQQSTLEDFFLLGANDYFSKPLNNTVFNCRVQAHLKTRHLMKNEEALKHELMSFNETLALKVEEKTEELYLANVEVIKKLAKASEYKDDVTGNHIQRVRSYSEVLSQKVGLSSERVKAIGLGAIMHDVGKMAIPDVILKKKGILTAEERVVMEQHPIYGEELFGDKPFFREAKIIAGGHHEKWDGSGYPRKLAAEDIPIEARIVALADVFDALMSPRPYKKAYSLKKSIAIIEEDSGSHFDPLLVSIFLELIAEGKVDKILNLYPIKKKP